MFPRPVLFDESCYKICCPAAGAVTMCNRLNMSQFEASEKEQGQGQDVCMRVFFESSLGSNARWPADDRYSPRYSYFPRVYSKQVH